MVDLVEDLVDGLGLAHVLVEVDSWVYAVQDLYLEVLAD